ncbi:MAG: IS3 family transposase [Bdellovibrionaceae bacterium]|nr:IS3 family transposase [Pseudobdellovibrionaceae bacterium]
MHWVRDNKKRIGSIKGACKMIKLSPSTYYYKTKNSRSEKDRFDANVRAAIEAIQIKFPKSGYRTMKHYLKRKGYVLGETRLRRIMKENNLQAKIRKKYFITTQSKHGEFIYPNLLPELSITDINQVWVADITYIRILTGFVFLAVIMDLYSRKIIGWSISKNIDQDLTLSALEMAITLRNPKAGVIHHADRGVQYLSQSYIKKLNDHEFHISCSRKGNPYDNAFCESLIKTIKSNEIDLKQYRDLNDVLNNLPEFITTVYNAERVHSALGYLTPEEFENKLKHDMHFLNKKHIVIT